MKKKAYNKSRANTITGKVDRAVLDFTVGRDPELDLHLVEWDCAGTAAHVSMLADMKIDPPLLSIKERDAIITELAAIIKKARSGDFRIRRADQDVHMAVERVLTEKLGATGRRIHTGRSRNDQVAVDLRLYAKKQLLDVFDDICEAGKALLLFGRRHAKVPMAGRTHLQPAMPSSVGLWASAYAEALLDDVCLLESAYAVNDRNPLGSAAGYGVPLPLDRELTTRLLGFSEPVHNVLYASCARGKVEGMILCGLQQVMLSLSRLAEDLILFSMPEFGYFDLPREFCTGSSIMPQKYNPDVLELIRAKTATVMGLTQSVLVIQKGLPGGYNRDLQETKGPLIEGFSTVRTSLRILSALIGGIKVNAGALRRGFIPGVFATDQALSLVAEGMPFRSAYDQVRNNLSALSQADPDAALARKQHLGAPAGLDWVALNTSFKQISQDAGKYRRQYYRRLSGLLGIDWGA